MKLGAIQRLASIDENKVGLELIHLSIKENAKLCSHLYFMQLDEIDKSTIELINSLNVKTKITKSNKNYGYGWCFQHNESLHDLYKTVPVGEVDWVMYHDVDNLPPDNIVELIKLAEKEKADTIRFHYIECLGAPDRIIEMGDGYPIGPHYTVVKVRDDIGFINSQGFSEPHSINGIGRLQTRYCIRHMRYMYEWQFKIRQEMNYYQDYFSQNHNTIEYKPNMYVEYYHKKDEKS